MTSLLPRAAALWAFNHGQNIGCRTRIREPLSGFIVLYKNSRKRNFYKEVKFFRSFEGGKSVEFFRLDK